MKPNEEGGLGQEQNALSQSGTAYAVANAGEELAGGIDRLSAILPAERRAAMAEVLTADDLQTLRHLAEKGMGANSLRALASDLNYLETWSYASTEKALPWPATEALVLKFISHHLYDQEQHERDERHGMPRLVRQRLWSRGCLRSDGPHAPATVRRRLALWSTMHRWKALEGPFATATVQNAMRLATRAAFRPRRRKSSNPVTRDVLDKLLATSVGNSLVDKRDRSLLLLAFASGGRRRSEVAKLRVEDLAIRPPVATDPADPFTSHSPCVVIHLGRTKTTKESDDARVILIGRPASALLDWIEAALLSSGPLFLPIDRFGRLGRGAIDGQSVNAILKKRCRLAGLPQAAFSAHGLRSGYMTEAARRGVPMLEAMRQSGHRSVQQAAAYYHEVDLERGLAGRLAD